MKKHLICSLILLSMSLVTGDEILKLGHTTDIILLKNSGDYLVSQDITGNWAIWELAHKKQILTGFLAPTAPNNIEMNNNTLVVNHTDAFDIYSLPNLSPKHVAIDSADSIHVSSDGRFIWTGNSANLKIWNSNGDQILKLIGNFEQTKISCDSIKLFVQKANADSLLVFSLAALNSLPSVHFQGTFTCWTDECQHFLTSQQGIARTYTSEGIRESIQDVGGTIIGGYGQYFLTSCSGSYPDGDTVKIYSIGTSNTPKKIVPTYLYFPIIRGANGYFGIIPVGYDSITVCKLGHDTVETFKSRGSGPSITIFECNSQGQWFTGNKSGVINFAKLDQPPQYLNYGKIRALSSAQNGKFAAATSSGQILIFQINNGTTTIVDSIKHNSSTLRLSSDGKILASQSNTTDAQYSPNYSSLLIFNTTNHNVIKKWDYELDDINEILSNFDLSSDGTVVSQKIGKFLNSSWSFRNTVSNISQDSAFFSIQGDFGSAPKISPDGKLLAIYTNSLVKIFKEKQLINAFSVSSMGNIGGWYNNFVIINNYESHSTIGGTVTNWLGTDLYDTLGKSNSNLKFPAINNPTVVSDTELFALDNNGYWSIYNLNTGKKVFNSKDQSTTIPYNYAAIPVDNDIVIYQDNTTLNLVYWRQSQSAVVANKNIIMHSNKVYLNKNQLTAEFMLNQTQAIKISIFSLNGAMVKSFPIGNLNTGYHKVCIPMNNDYKSDLAIRNPMVIVLYAGHNILLSKTLVQIKRF